MRRTLLYLALIFGYSALHANGDILDKTLSARDLGTLKQSLGRPEADDTTIPKQIFQRILKNSKDDKAWMAAYHYRSLTDAGSTLVFRWICFDALMQNPVIYRDRFILGDDRAANLMKDAMWSDGSVRWGNLYGAATANGFKDVDSYHMWLFARLSKDTFPPTETVKCQQFKERARADLLEAQREMNLKR